MKTRFWCGSSKTPRTPRTHTKFWTLITLSSPYNVYILVIPGYMLRTLDDMLEKLKFIIFMKGVRPHTFIGAAHTLFRSHNGNELHIRLEHEVRNLTR